MRLTQRKGGECILHGMINHQSKLRRRTGTAMSPVFRCWSRRRSSRNGRAPDWLPLFLTSSHQHMGITLHCPTIVILQKHHRNAYQTNLSSFKRAWKEHSSTGSHVGHPARPPEGRWDEYNCGSRTKTRQILQCIIFWPPRRRLCKHPAEVQNSGPSHLRSVRSP